MIEQVIVTLYILFLIKTFQYNAFVSVYFRLRNYYSDKGTNVMNDIKEFYIAIETYMDFFSIYINIYIYIFTGRDPVEK